MRLLDGHRLNTAPCGIRMTTRETDSTLINDNYQIKFQQYDQIKVEDVGSSSETESESESEAIVPSGMLPFHPLCDPFVCYPLRFW